MSTFRLYSTPFVPSFSIFHWRQQLRVANYSLLLLLFSSFSLVRKGEMKIANCFKTDILVSSLYFRWFIGFEVSFLNFSSFNEPPLFEYLIHRKMEVRTCVFCKESAWSIHKNLRSIKSNQRNSNQVFLWVNSLLFICTFATSMFRGPSVFNFFFFKHRSDENVVGTHEFYFRNSEHSLIELNFN